MKRGRKPVRGSRYHAATVEIGRRIKQLRAERGMSQSALAAHMGVTFQQIQKYESGSNRVSAAALAEIAKYLRVPVGYFFDDVEVTEERQALDRETMEMVRNYHAIPQKDMRTIARRMAALLARIE